MTNINLKKTKMAKSTKLIDILKGAEENNASFALTSQVSQGNINTQQEILNIQGQLGNYDAIITSALQSNPFSASALYKARKEKQLLEMKLDGLKDILAELF